MTAKKCGFLFGQGVGFVSDYPEQEGLVGHSPHREQTRPKVNSASSGSINKRERDGRTEALPTSTTGCE